MSSIFKTTKLTNSKAPFILPQNLQSIDSLEFDGLDGKKTLRQELDSSFTDAFIVLKNGEIIFEEYQNNFHDLHARSIFIETKSRCILTVDVNGTVTCEEAQMLNNDGSIKSSSVSSKSV